MHGLIRALLLQTLCIMLVLSQASASATEDCTEEVPTLMTKVEASEPNIIFADEREETTKDETEEQPDAAIMSDEETYILALIAVAEAEGECEEGQRLVIDTVLNRVDSEYFPDNVHDVVYQKNQFSSVWNGRADRCIVQDYILDLVDEELKSRTNNEVMFFTAGEYSSYGEPMFQVGNHYFSSYE